MNGGHAEAPGCLEVVPAVVDEHAASEIERVRVGKPV
jgi:hypothetical protein